MLAHDYYVSLPNNCGWPGILLHNVCECARETLRFDFSHTITALGLDLFPYHSWRKQTFSDFATWTSSDFVAGATRGILKAGTPQSNYRKYDPALFDYAKEF